MSQMHAQGTKMTTPFVHFYSVLPTKMFTFKIEAVLVSLLQ